MKESKAKSGSSDRARYYDRVVEAIVSVAIFTCAVIQLLPNSIPSVV